MGSYHFYDRMERDINLFREYKKFEFAICSDSIKGIGTFNDYFEKNFLQWPFRQNYMSLEELRNTLGFSIQWTMYGRMESIKKTNINIGDFLTYCEIINSLYQSFGHKLRSDARLRIEGIIDTMKYDLGKFGYEFRALNDGCVIITQSNKSIAVIDYVKPDIADAIIEYNHHALKGDIEHKRRLLKIIAEDLEAKREKIKQYNSKSATDFFFLVNNMNIRHNNCDPDDPSKYCEAFAKLREEEKELWYDDIYQLAVYCYMILENSERKKRIEDFKSLR